MAKKERSLYQKIATGVTGRTPEQRRADALLKSKIKQKQMESYRAEQLNQASIVGKRKAEIQAQRQIKQMSESKTSGGLNIGAWGKTKEGFDPFAFGVPAGKMKKKKKIGSILQGIPD